MATGLTDEQLRKIVEEVSRMSGKHTDQLEREDVKKVLEELNLPPEMLDEAILRVNYREAMKRHEADNRRIWQIAAVLLVGAIAGGLLWFQHRQSNLASVVAVQDRITLAQDNGGNLTTIDRQQAPEVFYRVTLNEAPVGDRLSLQCNWTNPEGAIVRQNRYETRKITTPVWNTYCRLPVGSATETGTWTVEMILNQRSLEDAQFEVR